MLASLKVSESEIERVLLISQSLFVEGLGPDNMESGNGWIGLFFHKCSIYAQPLEDNQNQN